ncbi:anti-sigma-K factor RskA [Stackebrandtia albiflava]|uniref:Regulator of SigK n=1 Tax=Stackebrandtia albiflava TaxID=406432 RepID=A0A562VAM6_9ACTN|nr:anti-sigma factor [Stackebrandtia albiflava]TWJ14932.1 anti-sigma-K factor RskA [Stackebrandtia albiflava]
MTTEVHTLIGPYALHALDEEERDLVERHIAECESCALELRELRATAARLADFTIVDPPQRLRTQVLGAVRRTRQLAPGPARPPAGRTRDGASVRRFAGRRRVFVTAAAIVVMALVSSLVTFAVMQGRVDQQRAEQARQEQMEAVLTASDADFTRRTAEGGGTVSMVSSESLDQAVVILTDLAPISDEQSYQLWLVHGDRQVSAGVVPAGHNTAMRLVTGISGADVLGVTAEPAGGSETPTLPMVADLAMPTD